MPVSQPASRTLIVALLLVVSSLASGCITDEDIFTEGRLEDLCLENIPVCNKQAQCILGTDEYFRGEFPGGLRLVARTQFMKSKLIVGFLLTEPINPGTELQVQVFTSDCGDFNEEHPQDRDLFEFAGDDRTIFFEIEMDGLGDHLVEIFSDMTSEYILRFELEERR